jgi:hypothetical protein
MSDASKPEHPAPWRWKEKGSVVGLLAANETEPLFTASGRELIRLAPELEALLRKLEWSSDFGTLTGPCCPDCGARRPIGVDGRTVKHKPQCGIAAILAALDAARKETP